MNSEPKPDEHITDHLPEDLKDRVARTVSLDEIWAVAPFDLDDRGMYVESYLILTDGKLAEYVDRDGQWRSRWFDIKDFSEAAIVEGLGMSLLRLLSGGKCVDEFRFTMRHAKAVAKLHRQLQRQIEGKELEELEPLIEHRRPDERRLRCEKCGRVIPAWSETCPACTSRRKILFRLLDFVKPYKARVLVGLVLALMMLVLDLIPPGLTKRMLDEGLGATGNTPNWPLFLRFLILWAGLLVSLSVCSGIQNRVMAKLGASVARDMRSAVYTHLHKMSLSFFGRKQTGSLVTRTTSDTDRLNDFVAFSLVEVVMAMLTIVGVTLMMMYFHWRLAVFTLLPVPIMFGLMAFFHKRMHRIFLRIWHRWSQMTSVVAGALPGVRVIKAFGQEDREVERFETKSGQVFDEEMSIINIWTAFGPMMRFCAMLGMLIIWLLGGWWIVKEFGEAHPAMTVGTLMAFTQYMQRFYRPIHQIAHMDRRFNRAATSAQRVFEVLDTEPAIFSRSGAHRPDRIDGHIELRNVSFSYDGIRKVLKDINIDILPGEMVGLAGPSGGGKTTLINLICRFYDVMEKRSARRSEWSCRTRSCSTERSPRTLPTGIRRLRWMR